jgi:transposase
LRTAKPISSEKRAGIVRHAQSGRGKAETAERPFVCARTVTRAWDRFLALGACGPEPQSSGGKPLVGGEAVALAASRIGEAPGATLAEPIDGFGLPFSRAALPKRLIGLGMTYKKSAPSKPQGARGRRGGERRLAVRPGRGGRGEHALAGRDRRGLRHGAPVRPRAVRREGEWPRAGRPP